MVDGNCFFFLFSLGIHILGAHTLLDDVMLEL